MAAPDIEASGLKFYPAPGSPLTLSNAFTGYSVPYTVVGKAPGGKLRVRECQLVFDGPRYFDSTPDRILPGRPGIEQEIDLVWKPKRKCWAETGKYGMRAWFGKTVVSPYVD